MTMFCWGGLGVGTAAARRENCGTRSQDGGNLDSDQPSPFLHFLDKVISCSPLRLLAEFQLAHNELSNLKQQTSNYDSAWVMSLLESHTRVLI